MRYIQVFEHMSIDKMKYKNIENNILTLNQNTVK